MRTVSDKSSFQGTFQANTETGLLLLIDPCVLFTKEEWSELDHSNIGSYIQAIKKKFKRSCGFSVVYSLGGDGIHAFEQKT